MHFFWRSSRVMSTPPYDVDRDQILLFAWIIGKKFDRIMRSVSHARVKWLQNGNVCCMERERNKFRMNSVDWLGLFVKNRKCTEAEVESLGLKATELRHSSRL